MNRGTGPVPDPIVTERAQRVDALLARYPSMRKGEAFVAVAREDGVSTGTVQSAYYRVQRRQAKANGTTPAPTPAPLPPPPASTGDAEAALAASEDDWVAIQPPSLRVLLQEALRRLDQMDKLVR